MTTTNKTDVERDDCPDVLRRVEAVRGPGRTLESRELFAGRTEIGIEHEGALYRLKITRQGKLILNK